MAIGGNRMSTPEQDGGATFPCDFACSTGSYGQEGMKLRDYFAGQALAGLLANPNWVTDFKPSERLPWSTHAAYALADAMLAEREKAK